MRKYYIKSGELEYCCVAGNPEEAIAVAVNHYRETGNNVAMASVIGVNEHGFLEFDRITKDERIFVTNDILAKMFGDT